MTSSEVFTLTLLLLGRRFGNSESTQDLLRRGKSLERRVSLDSNENQFIVSFGVEDHMSAHVNPVLTIGEYGRPSCLIACGVWKREKREKPHARARTHILNAFYQGCIPDSFAYLDLFFLLWRFEKCNWESVDFWSFRVHLCICYMTSKFC